ncbi:hypothetical protein BJX61DRAFT_539122 [Aspergillus egyptiacus]|nr:hypothetical protein BJX61DRAFT_539122 [Aspergillus egyptiacus]
MAQMAPIKFTRPPDLSGRTPIYRLTKTPVPVPAPAPAPVPAAPVPPPHASPSHVNNTTTTTTTTNNNPAQPNQLRYQPSPYQSPYPNSQSTPSQQLTPQDNKENEARGSPLTKRRGRKLQENEILTLVNCCLEYQSMYHSNTSRFWYCVATSLKRAIKRNFSWQSCRQIIEELVAERRERRRDVAAGKVKEQPLTELVMATDQWIAVCDAPSAPPNFTTPVQPLKRTGLPDSPATDPTAAKRPRQNDLTPSGSACAAQPGPPPPHASHSMPPYPMPQIPTVPSGPTMSEFQTLKVDIQSLRMDVQSMRREMRDAVTEMNSKLDQILRAVQQAESPTDSRET